MQLFPPENLVRISWPLVPGSYHPLFDIHETSPDIPYMIKRPIKRHKFPVCGPYFFLYDLQEVFFQLNRIAKRRCLEVYNYLPMAFYNSTLPHGGLAGGEFNYHGINEGSRPMENNEKWRRHVRWLLHVILHETGHNIAIFGPEHDASEYAADVYAAEVQREMGIIPFREPTR